MSIIKELEKQVEKKIEESGYEIDNFKLQVTNRPDLGEYQINDAMQLAKKYHKNPREIAEDITEEQIDYMVKEIKNVVDYLRSISPVWDELQRGEQKHVI